MRAAFVELAQREDAQAESGPLHFDARTLELAQQSRHRHIGIGRCGAELLAVTRRGVFVLKEAVQKRGVRRIDADLERLQPVALDHAFESEGVAVRRDKAVELGEGRRRAVTEIGKQDATALDYRIGARPDLTTEGAAGGLGRHFEALSASIEQAAQAGGLQPAISQVGAAVRAIALDQRVLSLRGVEQYKILAEQPHRPDWTRPLQLVN